MFLFYLVLDRAENDRTPVSFYCYPVLSISCRADKRENLQRGHGQKYNSDRVLPFYVLLKNTLFILLCWALLTTCLVWAAL